MSTRPATKSVRTITDSQRNQIKVLKVLAGKNDKSREAASADKNNDKRPLKKTSGNDLRLVENKFYEIGEIAELAGFEDEKEAHRALLILEGLELVSPVPKGDFTSSRWNITSQGLRTMSSLSKSMIAA